jgi:hypothetical protein
MERESKKLLISLTEGCWRIDFFKYIIQKLKLITPIYFTIQKFLGWQLPNYFFCDIQVYFAICSNTFSRM